MVMESMLAPSAASTDVHHPRRSGRHAPSVRTRVASAGAAATADAKSGWTVSVPDASVTSTGAAAAAVLPSRPRVAMMRMGAQTSTMGQGRGRHLGARSRAVGTSGRGLTPPRRFGEREHRLRRRGVRPPDETPASTPSGHPLARGDGGVFEVGSADGRRVALKLLTQRGTPPLRSGVPVVDPAGPSQHRPGLPVRHHERRAAISDDGGRRGGGGAGARQGTRSANTGHQPGASHRPGGRACAGVPP